MMNQAQQYNSTLIIVTGWRNTGKTTLCQVMIDAAHMRGLKVSGLLSPGIFKNYQKTRIEIEDLQTKERRVLAQQGYDPNSEFHLPAWIFDKETLTWGNRAFEQAVPTDVLIVDELGPIELEQNKGWQAAIQALDSGLYTVGIVVIRPELLKLGKQRWPQAQTVTLQSVNLVPSLSAEMIRTLFPNSV